MSVTAKTGAVALALSLVTFAVHPSFAQTISAEHLAVARKAVTATQATNGFDILLPQAALDLKNQLVNNNPDLAAQIDVIVDEEAIALAARRADLENEAAQLFANAVSQEELEKIAGFFSTDAGKKYLNNFPILARELSKAARIWGSGIRRDLGQNSSRRLSEAQK